MPPEPDADLAVIGGGSGGIGAALAAAREGLRVVLVERDGLLGGTSTLGGVHCWEMGAGGTGIPFDLYRRMRRIPRGAGVYSFARHCCWPEGGAFPGGEQRIDPARRYLDTLRRHGAQSLSADEAFVREHWHGIPFEPVALHTAARELLAATGCCNVLLGKELVSVEAEPGGARIRAVRLHDGSRLRARAWVDATGDATLCRMAGCELVSGQEPRSRYHEPAAPEAPTDTCNAATLIYRIRPADRDAVEPLPADIPADCWWADRFPVMSCTEYPNGDRNCNMLPTLEGEACRRLGPDAARREGIRRVRAHWHALQTAWPEFRRFRLAWIAPRMGVRESARVVCERVLTQNDVLAGLPGQADPDLVAVADHALDRHGAGGAGCDELAAPYGIPYRCLAPRGRANLLVACRAAGFSSIAATSCRLSRTLMQLGQAAGTAAALAAERGTALPEVDPAALRQRLRDRHVQLTWPLDPALRDHLATEPDPPA